jgi:KDO2-lipid IV(A) lauroyltransferase
LPLGLSLFLGSRLGELIYYFDKKHKSIAYANIKTAFKGKLSPAEINRLTKEFYRAFGENLIEIFFIPLVNQEYFKKYIKMEGLNNIEEGFRKGKGVILLAMHEGSWELYNIICANLGFPFTMFIRDQKHPRLNKLLNFYRMQKGCKVIQRDNETRQLIQILKNNEAIGMTADQGGKTGINVKFFGKDASMPSGAIKLALKYGAAIIPSFYLRGNGPYIKVILGEPFGVKKTGDKDIDLRNNLQELVGIFEKHILKYPKEYLWSYKIWKYTKEKDILILGDGKTGHLRQSESLAKIVSSCLKYRGINANIDTLPIKFKNRFSRSALTFSSGLSGKYHCQGCLWCLKAFLDKNTYKSLIERKPDIVISCGSSIAPINYIISKENLAKSMVVLRPSILSTKRFDLVIMPRHDRPPKVKKVVVTEGVLNLIDEEYLESQAAGLTPQVKIQKDLVLGLLLGGDTKDFRLSTELLKPVISQIKLFLEKYDGEILITTSRRTKQEVENLIRQEFKYYSRCKLLIIANERNIPEAVGGILGLSKIVVVSPESISMISEAASSADYIIVFNSQINKRHNDFLDYASRNKYIYLCEPQETLSVLEKLYKDRPAIKTLNDKTIVKEAVKAIL